MKDFYTSVMNAVRTLKRAGGTPSEVRIEPERLSDFFGEVEIKYHARGDTPPSIFGVQVIADPNVDAYEVMLEREVSEGAERV